MCMPEIVKINLIMKTSIINTGELGYNGRNGTRTIGPSYAKSIVYI